MTDLGEWVRVASLLRTFGPPDDLAAQLRVFYDVLSPTAYTRLVLTLGRAEGAVAARLGGPDVS